MADHIKFRTGSGIPTSMNSNELYFTKEGRLYYNSNLIGESLDKLSVGFNNDFHTSKGNIVVGSGNDCGVRGWFINNIANNNDGSGSITISNISDSGSRDSSIRYIRVRVTGEPAYVIDTQDGQRYSYSADSGVAITGAVNDYQSPLEFENCIFIDELMDTSSVYGKQDWVGHHVCFVAEKRYDMVGPISRVIETSSGGGYGFILEFDNGFPVTDADGCPKIEVTQEFNNNCLFIPDFPDDGVIDLVRTAAVFGEGNKCLNSNTIVVGASNTAIGLYGAVFGAQNTGTYATLVGGRSNSVLGWYSASFGYNNTIQTKYSSALGSNNTVEVGTHQGHAYGQGNTIKNPNNTYAVGFSNTSNGVYSYTFGYNNQSVPRTIALGLNNTIISNANNSTIVGCGNSIDATNSESTGRHVLIGNENKILSTSKINTCQAFGHNNTFNVTNAGGNCAFIYGLSNTANNPHTTSLGEQLVTTAYNQTVIGMYNDTTVTSASSVNGNGNGEIIFGVGSSSSNRKTAAIFNSSKANFKVPVVLESSLKDKNGSAGTSGQVLKSDGSRVYWASDSNTDTKNTTGTTNKLGTKLYLVGAGDQKESIGTYSSSACFIGADNCLYSGSTKVSVEGHKHNSLYATHIGEKYSWTITPSYMNSADDGFGGNGRSGVRMVRALVKTDGTQLLLEGASTSYCDALLMDGFDSGLDANGPDYVTSLFIEKVANPRAWIVSGQKGNTTGWANAYEIITTNNLIAKLPIYNGGAE